MPGLAKDKIVAVIGAGTMGAGIAQVAATAGHTVLLYDAAPGAAKAGRDKLALMLEGLARKGKIADAHSIIARIGIAETLAVLAGAALVIEAIVERLDIKQAVFAQLEAICAPDTILASNTSSLSITAIGAQLAHPARLAGLHFFNPAPVMKLVEVISGLATDPAVTQTLLDTARAWGKIAVAARSTPGFIVNRVARAYYGEALRLTEEAVASPATLDALYTEGGGFRLGPFALMDMIGHDVNYAVSQSIFEAYHHEPRFRPSVLQKELVDAGRLGRKSGRGFYDYAQDATQPQPASEDPAGGTGFDRPLTLTGAEDRGDLLIVLTDGRTAARYANDTGRAVIVHDLCDTARGAKRLGFACSPHVSAAQKAAFVATLATQGITATHLPDWPGLVVMRTVAAIANEGFEAVLQQVATAEAIDNAMIHGVNYPKGPLAWAQEIGLERILGVLDTLQAETGDMRYRPSLALRQAASGMKHAA